MSFHKYQDPQVSSFDEGRGVCESAFTTVEAGSIGVHSSEHETGRFIASVFVQLHTGAVVCMVENLFFIVKEEEFPFGVIQLWARHRYIVSRVYTDGFPPGGALTLRLRGTRQSAAHEDQEHPASTHLDLLYQEREPACSRTMPPRHSLIQQTAFTVCHRDDLTRHADIIRPGSMRVLLRL